MSISNLDWGKIDDPKRFQRLVNDLFAFETKKLEFIPSSPDIGKDKGFDGRIDGAIPFLNIEQGKTMLQSKHLLNHLEQPAKVMAKVKSDLLGSKGKKGEIQKALDENCEILILATNGNLGTDNIKILEGLKPEGLDCLHILDQERLRTQIIQHPFLALYYFDNKVDPTFVPPLIYIENKEKSLNEYNLDRNHKVFHAQFEAFISDKKKSILHISAPGGYGKSHLLSNIAKGEFLVERDREILYVDVTSYRPIEKGIDEEIVKTLPNKKYLILFDDIDRDIGSLDPLLQLVGSLHNLDIKLVFTTRSSSKFEIERKISSLELSSHAQFERIDDWSEDNLEQILKHENPKIEDAKARFLVRKYRNPYIISWVAKKIKGEELDPKDLHDRLFQQLNTDIQQALTGIGLAESKINKLLFNTLSILPFAQGNQDTYSKLASLLNIELGLVEDIFERLVKVGIMRVIAGSLRINPDLKGDIALQHLITNKPKSEIVETFSIWAPSHLNNLLFNINSASYYGEVDKLNELLDDEVSDWIKAIKSNQAINIKQLLKLAEYIARFLPTRVAEFLEALIDNSKQLELKTDDLGPLMKILRYHPESQMHTLRLLINKYHQLEEGTYSNYRSDDIAKDFLNPLPEYNSFNSLERVLDYYDEHKDSNNASSSKIILISLSEILSASHEHKESYGITMTFGRRTLRSDDRLIAIRQKALDLVLYYLSRYENETYLLALDAADKVGESVGSVGTSETELKDTFISEQTKIIHNIDIDRVNMLDVGTQIKVEDFLLEWWAQEKGGSDKALDLIRSMKRDLLFYVVKSIKSRSFIGKDLDAFLNYEPKERARSNKESRWNWFVNATFDQAYETAAIKPICNDLAEEIKTTTALIGFLDQVSNSIEPEDWKPYTFISHWVALNVDLFIEVHQLSWQEVPVVFKPAIESAIIINNNNYVKIVTGKQLKSIRDKSFHEVSVMLEGVFKFDSKNFPQVCAVVIKKTGVEYSPTIADSIWRYYRHTKDVKNSLMLAEKLLRKYKKFTPPSIDYVQFVITDILKDKPDFEFSNRFRKLLMKLLRRYPTADHDFTTILSSLNPSLEEVMNTIGYRLELQNVTSFIRYGGYYAPPASSWGTLKHLWRTVRKHLDFFLKFPYEYINFRKDLTNYDAFPIDGLAQLSIPITNYSEYQKYLNFLNDLEGRVLLGSYDIDHLTQNVVLLGNNERTPWYRQYLDYGLEENSIDKALFLLDALPVSYMEKPEVIKMLDEFYSRLATSKQKKQYGSILWSKAMSGGYSSAVGEVPQQFLDRKALFSRMKEMLSLNENKEIMISIVSDIDNQIDSHKRSDEAILYER